MGHREIISKEYIYTEYKKEQNGNQFAVRSNGGVPSYLLIAILTRINPRFRMCVSAAHHGAKTRITHLIGLTWIRPPFQTSALRGGRITLKHLRGFFLNLIGSVFQTSFPLFFFCRKEVESCLLICLAWIKPRFRADVSAVLPGGKMHLKHSHPVRERSSST